MKTAKSPEVARLLLARGRRRRVRGQAGRGRGDARRRDRRRDGHDGAGRPDQGAPARGAGVPLARRRGSGSSSTRGRARPRSTAPYPARSRPSSTSTSGRTAAGSRPKMRSRWQIGSRDWVGSNLSGYRDTRAICNTSATRASVAGAATSRWSAWSGRCGDLRAGGHAVEVVTTGGTGTAEFCAAHEIVTEVQPGSFIFMDTDYSDTGGVPYRHGADRRLRR